MEHFLQALQAGAFATANPNSIAVYALLCCFEETPSVKEMSTQLGMLPSRVSASISDLKRRRLLSEDNRPIQYEATEMEYHIIPATKIAESVKEKLTKSRNAGLNSILTEKAAPAFGKKKRHSSGKAFNVFKEAYEEKFEKTYPLSSKMGSVYCKRLLTWLADDFDGYVKTVHFYMENWDEIKEKFKVKGTPSLNLLATGSFFGRIRDTMVTGFIDERTLLKRFKEDDSPEAGFSE